MANLNGWDAAQKLKWLKVRRAQIAFQRLPQEARADFKEAKKALTERFEPIRHKSHYQAEFQARCTKKIEAWADFAEDLEQLADHTFPDLEDKARECIALNVYMQNLEHPQVAFQSNSQVSRDTGHSSEHNTGNGDLLAVERTGGFGCRSGRRDHCRCSQPTGKTCDIHGKAHQET